jgi:hypothetical protein
MKLSKAQENVLRLMGRTGVISLENLKRRYPRWQKPLIALMNKCLVEEYGVGCYALTQKASGFMPKIMQ